MLWSGKHLQSQLGPQYNIISFDPRGVQNSGIWLTCFPRLKMSTKPHKRYSEPESYEKGKALGRSCARTNSDSHLRYVGTVANVHDMAHFLALNHAQKGRENSDDGKLWYFGISYGTVIGHTFASLFPEKVGRMVLAGNIDSMAWYAGADPESASDTDKAVMSFFTSCFDAGPANCAFYGNSTSPEDMVRRYQAILDRLRDAPSNGQLSRIKLTFIRTLYDPPTLFASLARQLRYLEHQGVAQPYAKRGTPLRRINYYNLYATPLIRAVDVDGNSPAKTYAQFRAVQEAYQEKSPSMGSIFAYNDLPFTAAFDKKMQPPSQHFAGFDPAGAKTHNPILFVNALRDPVTPIASARKMSALFPGSEVLAVNVTGHGSRMDESSCVGEYIRAYLEEGVLPAPEMACQPDGPSILWNETTW